jgi:hypothetical protein
VDPLPEKFVSVPTVADTSDAVNVVVDSLTVKVTEVVEPEVTDVDPALMETVGAPVSYVIESVLLAVLLLPTASVKVEPLTEMDPVPELTFVVGVNVAV